MLQPDLQMNIHRNSQSHTHITHTYNDNLHYVNKYVFNTNIHSHIHTHINHQTQQKNQQTTHQLTYPSTYPQPKKTAKCSWPRIAFAKTPIVVWVRDLVSNPWQLSRSSTRVLRADAPPRASQHWLTSVVVPNRWSKRQTSTLLKFEACCICVA